MAKVNAWERLWGASRRAKDKAILAECERAIAAEDRAKLGEVGQSWVKLGEDGRTAIARAFGRPLQ